MSFFQFLFNPSFLYTHISTASFENLGTTNGEAPMGRCRGKLTLHNFRLLTSITTDAAGIITDVESAMWKKDLTETWKSSEERIQGESQCNNREVTVTGKSTVNRGKTGHGDLKACY